MSAIGRAVALVLLATGCSAPWKLRSAHTDIDSARARTALPRFDQDLIPLRCVLHVHSKFSHDSRGKIEDIARAARKNGVAAVFLTDHTNPRIFTDCPAGMIDGVWFVRGEEVSICGSLLALGTQRCVGREHRSAQQVVDEIKAQGGVCCVSHIEHTDPFSITGYDAIGVHNLHADAKLIPFLRYPWLFFDALFYRHLYGSELLLRHLLRVPRQQLRTWDELLKTRRVTAISEADAHENIRLFGMQIDPYELFLGVEHTYLLVPRNWTEADLLDAIRDGRTYVGLTMVADPRGFAFTLEQGDRSAGTIGDEVRWEPALSVRVRCPLAGRIVILCDGRVVSTARGQELSLPCAEAGVYRAEVWVKVGGRELPWILSSPIYVREALPDSEARAVEGDAVAAAADQRGSPRASSSR